MSWSSALILRNNEDVQNEIFSMIREEIDIFIKDDFYRLVNENVCENVFSPLEKSRNFKEYQENMKESVYGNSIFYSKVKSYVESKECYFCKKEKEKENMVSLFYGNNACHDCVKPCSKCKDFIINKELKICGGCNLLYCCACRIGDRKGNHCCKKCFPKLLQCEKCKMSFISKSMSSINRHFYCRKCFLI